MNGVFFFYGQKKKKMTIKFTIKGVGYLANWAQQSIERESRRLQLCLTQRVEQESSTTIGIEYITQPARPSFSHD